MVILSESDGTKSASGVVLVLRDPEPDYLILDVQRLYQSRHTKAVPQSTSSSTNWASATAPFRSGSLDGQESSPLPIQAISIPSKVDLVPSNPMLPVNLTQSELTESMLVPLVNQFGMMQQQMFDQFQQAMAMMVQMFGTMHRDQMEVIRAELDQLRELTEEFHALKNELAKRTQNQDRNNIS